MVLLFRLRPQTLSSEPLSLRLDVRTSVLVLCYTGAWTSRDGASMKPINEAAHSLVGGAGLLIFMGGLIGGIALLVYQVGHFFHQGEWITIPASSPLEWLGMQPTSAEDAAAVGGLASWVLSQPLSALAFVMAIAIGWPLIVLSDRLMTGRKG